MAGEDAKKVSKKADDKDDREKEAAPSPPPPAPSPPPPKPGYFSVWAEPAHYDSTLHLIMTQLMEQHEGPAFLPHVTIMSHHWSSPEEAEASLKALCDCTLPFTLKVLRVESGTTYHQCIYLLMDKTQEVSRFDSVIHSMMSALLMVVLNFPITVRLIKCKEEKEKEILLSCPHSTKHSWYQISRFICICDKILKLNMLCGFAGG